jgi:tetratricopeptide (TPR) repeat protein
MTQKLTLTTSYLLAAAFLLASAVAGTTVETLGTVDFPNSGAPEAQDAFIRGVLLLHSFEYDDAKEAFVEAGEIDPEFAMAYWGEAMTYNHPLWRQQDREAALEVLEKIPHHDLTDREQGYLDALAVLYGEGDKVARDIAYSEAMRALSESHPEDLEAKSFYALSILGTTQAVRDFRTFMRAGAVAEEVFAVNPQHPGAAHYLIHSYDDPVHAPLGLRAARVYAQIAPAASHAQHMISHIYVAMGDWANSVDSNIKSFEVARERVARKGLGVDDLNFHSFHWLEYSYLQMAQFDKARPMVDRMREYAEESGSSRARGYYADMRASWIVETGGQDAPTAIGTDSMAATSAARDLFATGVSAVSSKDSAGARTALDELSHHLGELTPDPESKVDVETHKIVQVMTDSLRAVIAWTEGRRDEAMSLLEGATATEGEMALEYGPPSIVKPSNELFGELLLAAGQPEAAAEQFELALLRAPRRRLSLLGLAQASAASGELATNERTCNTLAEILGDMKIPYCEG